MNLQSEADKCQFLQKQLNISNTIDFSPILPHIKDVHIKERIRKMQ